MGERLTPELLIAAYTSGYFPMADMRRGRKQRIGWYSPDPRAVIPLAEGGLHVPRSLAKTIRRGVFEVTFDECFERVMRECAAPRTGEGPASAWISEEMIEVYTRLHQLGFAHSVEAWMGQGSERRLVGGVYGVSIRAAFFAESMFCRPEQRGTNASKVCLVELVNRLRRGGWLLLDVQIANPHTERFGVVELPRERFIEMLAVAVGGGPPLDPGTAGRTGDRSADPG